MLDEALNTHDTLFKVMRHPPNLSIEYYLNPSSVWGSCATVHHQALFGIIIMNIHRCRSVCPLSCLSEGSRRVSLIVTVMYQISVNLGLLISMAIHESHGWFILSAFTEFAVNAQVNFGITWGKRRATLHLRQASKATQLCDILCSFFINLNAVSEIFDNMVVKGGCWFHRKLWLFWKEIQTWINF